ncbi:tape measure protein, partial [Escherichia coli]
LRELIIKISANSQSFQSEIQRASRMGSEYYRTLQNGGRQAAAAARDQRRALAELNSQLTEIRGSAVGMAGAFAGAFATGHLISLADEWSSVNARLKQASQSSDEFSSSQKVLMDISQRTGTAFSDNAALFARSAASMREYGYSADDVLKVTEAISTGLKISGASTAEAGSVITQFSQALAQGVLRGEEFNSVNESGDRIVRALAAGMGVARKDLKAMADDGQLTADKVVPALISQLEVLRDEYAAMPETVSDGITKVENAFMAWVGGANEASGVTKTLSGVLNGVAGQIDNVATAVGALVAVGVARYFGNMASGAMSATAGLVTAARNEVALAEAQFRGTQIATARARAAVYRAQQAVAAARGTEMQIAAEARLAATQERLNRNIAARSAAQNALN